MAFDTSPLRRIANGKNYNQEQGRATSFNGFKTSKQQTPKESNKQALNEPLEPQTDLSILQDEADKKRLEIERAKAVFGEYQRNIRISEKLRADILKGANSGANIYDLFLKAASVISLMTSDTAFERQLGETVNIVYAEALQDPEALSFVKDGTARTFEALLERINRLNEILEGESNPDKRKKLQMAIRAHEERFEELQAEEQTR